MSPNKRREALILSPPRLNQTHSATDVQQNPRNNLKLHNQYHGYSYSTETCFTQRYIYIYITTSNNN